MMMRGKEWPGVRLGLMVSLLWAAPAPEGRGQEPLPWEVWHDLHRLAQLPPGDQVLLRSSHCPSGCRFDRHSDGDWRYVRLDGDEGVIFEEAGAGAITRIWMTMGQGVSQPLAPSVRLRIYVDGGEEPVLDSPLPDLFNGSTPPFLPPLVGGRLHSSGGNYSYVPISYRDGCRITLLGAHEERIWFQLTFHRLAEAGDVVSFSGEEDLSAWAALLGSPGEDPWLVGGGASGSVDTVGGALLRPGELVSLARFAGPDSLTAVRLWLPEPVWSRVELRLAFDGEERVRLPLTDFFAVGRGGTASTRSLLLGVAEDGSLYSFFPMPFFASAEVSLTLQAAAGSAPVAVTYQLRRANSEPSPASGLFGAQGRTDDETPIGNDIPLLSLEGRGKWVGLFAELGSVGTLSRAYLEGDERLFLDDAFHPAVYGTGTEDLFNGGFYFDQGSFRLALHGSPYHDAGDGEDVTAAYRLMLTDAVRFVHGLRAGLEGGPNNDLSLRARTVAYYYQRSSPGLWRWDVLHSGEPSSRAAHAYMVSGLYELRDLSARFEGEPARALEATGVYRPAGEARFRLRAPPTAGRLRLRRRLDAGVAGQKAEVRFAGTVVGHFPPVEENPFRRWREIDVDLPAGIVPDESGEIELRVAALPQMGWPPDEVTFTAFTYELWSDVDPTIFADAFESGDLSHWSHVLSAASRSLGPETNPGQAYE